MALHPFNEMQLFDICYIIASYRVCPTDAFNTSLLFVLENKFKNKLIFRLHMMLSLSAQYTTIFILN